MTLDQALGLDVDACGPLSSTLRRSSNMLSFSYWGGSQAHLPHMPYRHTITSTFVHNTASTRRYSTSLWILMYHVTSIYLTRPKSAILKVTLCLTHPRLPLARLTSWTLRWIALFSRSVVLSDFRTHAELTERARRHRPKTSYLMLLACASHASNRAPGPTASRRPRPPDTTPRRRHAVSPEPSSPPHGTHLMKIQ